jgi:hypothetical protein
MEMKSFFTTPDDDRTALQPGDAMHYDCSRRIARFFRKDSLLKLNYQEHVLFPFESSKESEGLFNLATIISATVGLSFRMEKMDSCSVIVEFF